MLNTIDKLFSSKLARKIRDYLLIYLKIRWNIK